MVSSETSIGRYSSMETYPRREDAGILVFSEHLRKEMDALPRLTYYSPTPL